MAPVRFHPQADQEAEAAAVWYDEQNPGLGAEFLTELARSVEAVSATPSRWPLWPRVPRSIRVRRFLLSRFPYGLAYLASGNDIVIIAVAHLARRPGYWLDRLK